MISCVAYGLTGATVWLNTPKIPNAASSAVIARTSGTIAATNAPNVSSRMMNVSPIVANVVSRLLLMRVVMSSLVRVELRVWTSKPLAAPSASMAAIAGRTGTRSWSTVSWSPVIVATMRTADRSGATSPAWGGEVAGSGMASNTGTVWPFTVAVRPLSVAMVLATNDANAGSVTFRSGCVTTSSTSSDGVPVPPWSKTARAFADSVCAWFGLPFASSARIPPVSALRTNTAMVPTNHAAATGHR